MIRHAQRGKAVRSTTLNSLILSALAFAPLAAGCGSSSGGGAGGAGGSPIPDAAIKHDTAVLQSSPDTAVPSPDLPPASPDLGKDTALSDTGAGGIVGLDAAGGTGGTGVDSGAGGALDASLRDAPADHPALLDQALQNPEAGSLDGAPIDGGSAICPSPVHAWYYPVNQFSTMAWDRDGSLVTGNAFYPIPGSPTVQFAGKQLTNAGSADALVAKLDPATGNATWVFTAGDFQDQTTEGTAVTSGNVVAYGFFTGTLDIDPVNGVVPPIINPATTAINYLMGLDDGTGAGAWSKKVDVGTGTLNAIAGNPGKDYFLVCGHTTKIPATLSPTGTLGGGKDVIVAAVKASNGTVMWAKVLGDAKDQACTAAALDDSGNAYFTGTYAGSLDFGLGAPLTFTSANAMDQAIWVAKLSGTDGTAVAAKSFGTAGGPSASALALDGQGNPYLAGALSSATAFGSQTLTPAPAGSPNAFVAKLDPGTLAPAWARSFAGGTGGGSGANAAAVDSAGRITVVGSYKVSLVVGSGLPDLQSKALTPTAIVEPFVITLDGASGASLCASRYGDPGSAGAGAFSIAINRSASGADRSAIGGYFTRTIDFGGQTTALSTGTTSASTGSAFLLEM